MNRFGLASAALGVILLAGCTHNQNAEVRENVQGLRQEIGAATENAKKAANNAALASRVKTTLSNAKGLDARGIDVEAAGDAVTLKGDVTAPEQAQMAERLAGEVKGVGSVTNRLTMHVPATPEAAANAPAKPAPADVR